MSDTSADAHPPIPLPAPVTRVIDALTAQLGRPLRILDLGSARSDVASQLAEVDEAADYDLVLGRSLLHQLIHRGEPEAAPQLVAALAVRIPHALFETAPPAEPRITLSPYP